MLLIVLFIIPGFYGNAKAEMLNLIVTPSPNTAGSVASYVIQFTLQYQSGAALTIDFPKFTVPKGIISTSNVFINSSGGGGVIANITGSGQLVVITFTIPLFSGDVYLSILSSANIHNPPTAGSYPVHLQTVGGDSSSYSVEITAPLSIYTSSLPDGTVCALYSQKLQARYGTGSYTWSIISGSFPPGLTLDSSTGIISGTPTTASTYNFTVQVKDSTQTATKNLSIKINSLPSPSAPINLIAKSYESSISLTWTASTQGQYPIASYAIFRGMTAGGESQIPIATVDVHTPTYTDSNVTQGKTYYYYVKAFNGQAHPNYSAPSNEVHAQVETSVLIITASAGAGGTILPSGAVTVNYGDSKLFTITPNPGYNISDVKVDGTSIGAISSYAFPNITSNHTIEVIFAIKTYTIISYMGTSGTISPSGTIAVTSGDSKSFIITPSPGYKISYVKVDGVSVGAVSSYTFTNITSNHTIEASFEKEITAITISLQIGNSSFIVNGVFNTLDSPPIIKNNRTLLPIRAIIESLGGTVSWDATEKKVTVILGNNAIELWIGKNTAKVNWVNKQIDSSNAKVVPEIINSRTMLPLRFVTESLGCSVDWNATTKTITIKYPK